MSTLKQDKMCALELLRNSNMVLEDLQKLNVELQKKEPDAPLKLMKELRSELWLIKKMRGAYGESTSSKMMNDIIDSKLSALEKAQGKRRTVKPEASLNPKAFSKLEEALKTPQLVAQIEDEEPISNFLP